MAQAQILKNNCTSGEISPQLHQRSELAQYQNGLETCLNGIVTPYGGVRRRYGTKYIYTAKHADKLCVLRKFEFAADESYVLEFGAGYIRFYFNNALILSTYAAWVTSTLYYPGDLVTEGGNYYRCLVEHTSGTFATDLGNNYWVATAGATDLVYEIYTPYLETELRGLRFEQSADVLYIFQKDHHPAKLTRYDHDFWTFESVPFTSGPFEDDNDTSITITPSAVTGDITATASSNIFLAGHIGSLWKISSGKATSEVTASLSSTTSSDPVKTGSETVEMEISGTWVATVVVERSFNNGTDWYPYQTISKNCVKKYSDTRDVQYRVTVTAFTSGTVGVRLSVLDPDEIGMGTVRITAVASGTSCSATVISELRSTDATKIWAEPSWSGVKGYPRVGKIYEGRLAMASTDYDIKGVWGSSSLEYENMKLGINDDDSFYFSLDAKGGINEAKWMESWKQLSIGTIGGEIRFMSSKAITPSNPPDKKQDSDYGSADIQGIVANKAIIFVDRCKRILREYMYDYNTDAFQSNSISVISEHILNEGDGIVDIAYQKKQDSIIWCVLEDGTLGALTYMPDQQVMGWHKHTLGGTGAEVESICVIPGIYGHDEVWMSVKREIDGSTVRYIELMYEDEYLIVSGYNFDCFESGYDFELDNDSTPETIVAGNAIDVYVTGGCAPFTWETTSTGYSFSSPTTTERNNVLNCVSGACGVAFDVIVNFTVTDVCGTVITGAARNTSGHWSGTLETLIPMQYHTGTDAFYCLESLIDDDELFNSGQYGYDCTFGICSDDYGTQYYYSEDKEYRYQQSRTAASPYYSTLKSVCQDCANGYPSINPDDTVWGAPGAISCKSSDANSFTIGGVGSGFYDATPDYPVPDISPLEVAYTTGDKTLSTECQAKCSGDPWFFFPALMLTQRWVC